MLDLPNIELTMRGTVHFDRVASVTEILSLPLLQLQVHAAL